METEAEAMKQELVELVINGESVSAQHRNMTLQGFFVSIGASILIFIGYLVGFCLLRRHLRSIYEPRTFIRSSNNGAQAPTSTNGLLSWITPVFRTCNTTIMETLGLDAYFFLRFIIFAIILCGIIGIPFSITLIPVHLSGKRQGVTGLDRISLLNVSESQPFLHIAHLMLSLSCMIACMVIFNVELRNYFQLRAKYMINKSEDDLSGSVSTILVKNINHKCCNEQTVAQLFNGLVKNWHGTTTVKKIWFNRDYSKLHALVNQRNSLLSKLEHQELWLIERCLGVGESIPDSWRNGNKDATITGNLWREYMSPNNLKLMYGKRGSKLVWLKGELSRLNSEIYALQRNELLSPVSNSCFIQFSNNMSAFVASRSLITSDTLGNGVKVYGQVYPADIIWSNLCASTWRRRASRLISIILNFMIIFGWAIPVALISIATQVDTMAHWMPQVHGAATSPGASYLMNSVMTPILVSSLTATIPYIFRTLSKFKGFPTNTLVEMDVQNYLFLFMFFQLFLIVTISTGLPALLLTTLVNTSEGAITLANSLPKATTFFISYVLASSLTTAGNSLLQSQQLCWAIYYRLFSRTPREKFRMRYMTSTIFWGSVYPLLSNVTSIAIAYSLISPIILLSAIIGLSALYVAFKYRILYCYIPRCIADGDYYPKAIFQLFAGIYCQQISLLGTLLVSGQMVMATMASMIIIATIVSHRHLRSIFVDMKTRIPVSELSRDAERKIARPFSGTSEITLSSQNHKSPKTENKSSPARSTHTSEYLDTSHGFFRSPNPSTRVGPTRNTGPLNTGPLNIGPLNAGPLTSGSLSEAFGPNSSPVSLSCGVLPSSTPHSSCTATCNTGTGQSLASPALSPGTPLAIDVDTWAKMFGTMDFEFNGLSSGQQEHIVHSLYEHPDRWIARPCVWLPNDYKNVAHDQVKEMQHYFPNLQATCDGSSIDGEGNVYITRAPPDFDPREIMRM